MHFAIKRLSQVEVSARQGLRRQSLGTSNQHELNAGMLRRELRLPTDVSADLELLFYTADDQEPVVERATYRLYDARRAKTHRSAEYRLYYHTDRVPELARAGDLLVVFRPETDGKRLIAVIVRQGTRIEGMLLSALRVDPGAALARFSLREDRRLERTEMEQIGQLKLLTEQQHPIAEHPLLAEALRSRRMPKPEELARAARTSIIARYGDVPPDEFLEKTVDEESRLYFGIEKVVNERKLRQMVEDGAQLNALLAFALSIFQSRKARRGLSLQSHFGALLTREGIPYTPQCLTERGETPDFVIPGQTHYSDRAFPEKWLRMVACKSAVRERWRQILNEAERIPEKYLLTLDPELSADLLSNMESERLKSFVPASTKRKAYALIPSVETVGDLIARLNTAVEQARRAGLLNP
ncbi:MAG: hypothetical protein JNJ54_31225 [Myxococcaceae bacterium]|nr:hypothetical protein [Myxococcaceae bacterium]